MLLTYSYNDAYIITATFDDPLKKREQFAVNLRK